MAANDSIIQTEDVMTNQAKIKELCRIAARRETIAAAFASFPGARQQRQARIWEAKAKEAREMMAKMKEGER